MFANYDRLAKGVVDWTISNGQSERIIAIDLETKVLAKNDFLTNETMLSFALARRVDGRIESEVLILDEESPKAESDLLQSVNQKVESIRPLIVLGYNVGGYDLPLIRMKLQQAASPYWALIDMVDRSFVLDLKYPVKFELARHDGSSPRVKSLEVVVNHPRFSNLPLARAKSILQPHEKEEKGAVVYAMWQHDRSQFERYASGDVTDVLQIFEELFVGVSPRTVGIQ